MEHGHRDVTVLADLKTCGPLFATDAILPMLARTDARARAQQSATLRHSRTVMPDRGYGRIQVRMLSRSRGPR